MTKTILHTSSHMKAAVNPDTQIVHLKYDRYHKGLFAEAKNKVRKIYDNLVETSDDEDDTAYLRGGFSALAVLGDSLHGELSSDDAHASLLLVSITVHDRIRRKARMGRLPEALKMITEVAVVPVFDLPLPPASTLFEGTPSRKVMRLYDRIRIPKRPGEAYLTVSEADSLCQSLRKHRSRNGRFDTLMPILQGQVALYSSAMRVLTEKGFRVF